MSLSWAGTIFAPWTQAFNRAARSLAPPHLVGSHSPRAGDIRAAQEIGDRAEGRASQSVEIQSAEMREAFERMSGEELDAYAREVKLPGWFPRQNGRT